MTIDFYAVNGGFWERSITKLVMKLRKISESKLNSTATVITKIWMPRIAASLFRVYVSEVFRGSAVVVRGPQSSDCLFLQAPTTTGSSGQDAASPNDHILAAIASA